MSNDMKLIMESWRSKMLLQEVDPNTVPATWGMFKGLLRAAIGAKQGLVGDALAKASGLFGFFGAEPGQVSDAAELAQNAMSFLGGVFTEQKKPLNEEVLTVGAVLLGLKYLGAIGQAKSTIDFLGKTWKKLRGQPTDETDSNSFLDLLNLDPYYSKIIDDRIEEAFLKDWLQKIEQKNDNDPIQPRDLDVNKRMQKFLKANFQNRIVQGHKKPVPPNVSRVDTQQQTFTQKDIQDKRSKVRKSRGISGLGKQV